MEKITLALFIMVAVYLFWKFSGFLIDFVTWFFNDWFSYPDLEDIDAEKINKQLDND